MTPQEKETIRQWAGRMSGGHVDIGLRTTNDERSAVLEAFCTEFQKIAPLVRVKKQDHSDPLPSFHIAANIAYQAVPSALELMPFLDFLEGIEDAAALAGLPESEILDQIKVPAALTIFVSPHCPVCPRTVTSLLILARRCPKIQLTVVDGVIVSRTGKRRQCPVRAHRYSGGPGPVGRRG